MEERICEIDGISKAIRLDAYTYLVLDIHSSAPSGLFGRKY